MRNVLIAGTAGLLLTLGAAGVANAANPNVPTYSPYTLMEMPGAVPEADRTSKPVAEADRMYEGRAAYVDDGSVQPAGYRDGFYHRDAQPFPFSVLPWNW